MWTRTITRRLACGLLAGFVLAPGAGAIRGEGASITFKPYRLEGQTAGGPVAEWGTLSVPENRALKGGRTIDLALIRLKSTAKAPGPPTLLVAGGPGSSGLAMARGPMLPFLARLLEQGDVIAFDQRGVGASRPALDCLETLDYPLNVVRTRQMYIDWARARMTTCAALWSARGVDLAAYHTEASADDIDAIRIALGANRINLLGGSYGSHLILSTIRRHGDRVNRAVIMGMEGPDHTIKLPSNEQAALENIARKVRQDAALGSVIPDFVGVVRTVLAALEQSPVITHTVDPTTSKTVPVTLSAFDLQLVTAQTLGALPLIAQLPAAYYDMAHGDFSWLAQEIMARKTRPIESAMSTQMDCASGISPERSRRIATEASQTLLSDVIDFPLPFACDATVPHDLGAAFRSTVKSNVPVLFLTGSIDGRTPPSNADEIAAGLPFSHRVVVDNAAHGARDVLLTSPETQAATLTFLSGKAVTITTAAIPPVVFATPKTLPQAAPAASASPAAAVSQSAALDLFIAQGMKDWNIPGLSIVVVKDGVPVYEKGVGVRKLGTTGSVDGDTLFGMMSTTKAMTAMALAILVDEGKVRWDDPVTKHLPWLRLPNPYLTEHVTVRDALRHSSGLANADLLWSREDFDTREVLNRLRLVPTTDSLRSTWIYHNVMYQVAGEIVASASGMPWDRFIATRILKPLGMTRSYAALKHVTDLGDSNVSAPHFEIDGTIRAIEDVTVDTVPAAGAAWTTAHDAGKWLAILLAGGQAGGVRLVSEASFAELFTPQVVIPVAARNYPTTGLVGSHWTTYGLGWFQQDYRGHFVAMHTGSMDGRTAMAGLVPDQKLGVFIFGNLDHAEFRHALLWKVIDLWTGAPERDWNAECLKLYGGIKDQADRAAALRDTKRVVGTKPSHPLDAYAGSYTHHTWGSVRVVLDKDGLVFRLGPSLRNAGRLEHWHYDTFRTRPGDGRSGWSYIGFTMGLDGNVNALVIDDSDLVFTRDPVRPNDK